MAKHCGEKGKNELGIRISGQEKGQRKGGEEKKPQSSFSKPPPPHNNEGGGRRWRLRPNANKKSLSANLQLCIPWYDR